jgi:hypothetical protein
VVYPEKVRAFPQPFTMGFALSILYFVTYYLSPETIFGPLAAYRIELIIAALVFFVSLPKLMTSFMVKTPQFLALIGLALAVGMSVLIGVHWAAGGVAAFLQFIPNAFAFFLVCLHCDTKKRLRIVVLLLLFVCLFVIVQGNSDSEHILTATNLQSGFTESPYIITMQNSAGEWIARLRGLGEINDPNDFSQLIISLIPMMFIFWQPKKLFRNISLVLLPVCVLLIGVFQTHSRGALVALMAVAVVAARRRIGTIPSLLLGGGLFVAAMALHFTGGRDISAESGADRTMLWGESLQLLKLHPFFGIGFGNLPDILGYTAHNTVAVCAAELGSFGLYFWCLFLFSTVRDVIVIATPAKVSEAGPIKPVEGLYPQVREIEAVDKAEINRIGRLLVLSLTGFLVAGWFLSRAFVVTLYLLGGMVEVIYEMALQRGMVAPRMRMSRVLPYAGYLAISLILLLYIMLRLVNLTH